MTTGAASATLLVSDATNLLRSIRMVNARPPPPAARPQAFPNRSEKRGPHLATKRASQWFCHAVLALIGYGLPAFSPTIGETFRRPS